MNPQIKTSGLLLVFLIIIKSSTPLLTPDQTTNSNDAVGGNAVNILNPDQPLFLTPYIERGDVETGRSLSRVGQLPNAPSVPSYSGFFTVNKEYNSNLFFWFFPALNNDAKAPVILWVQGGPGASGLLGLFVEHGPYIMHSNTTAGLRNYTWAREYHMIFVDSPAGTGFSFTDNEKGYATNQDQITDNLYEFLKQFFEVYYEYGQNDFYICGESYAGKHVPYLGHKLHTDGTPAGINFKGVAIGNGFIDIHMYDQEEFLYELGVVNKKQATFMKDTISSVIQNVQKGNTSLAMVDFNKLLGIFQYPINLSPTYITQFSGYTFFYNFLNTSKPDDYTYHNDYIQSPQSRRAIHVGNLTFHDAIAVQKHMGSDILVSSSRTKLATLMENYKVLVYNGYLDLAVPYVTTENVLQSMTWKYGEEYKAADRKIWRLGNYVAGYVQSAGNFSFVLVRNAGHLVPRDLPLVGYDLITRFINGVPYA